MRVLLVLPGGIFVALLRHSAAGLAALGLDGTLGARIAEQMSHRTGRRPSPAEMRSWDRSLPVLAQDLVHAGLDKVEMLVEHHLPLTSKRIDVILAGQHPITGKPSYVLVELKQWSGAEIYESQPELVLVDGYSHDPQLHPIEQIRGYCRYLVDFTRWLQDLKDPIVGIAYLHNATDQGVNDLFRIQQDDYGRLFTGQRRAELISFLRSRLDPDVPGAPFADSLLGSAVAPSRQLLAVAADEIRDREQFVLVDEQQLAFSVVLHEVERARQQDTKTVVLVTGGPGSGKSVIALSLLGELARQGRLVLHATGSRSFTQTLRKVAGKGSSSTQSLFKYFNSFSDAERNGLDVLILDEAHRIRETSANRWTRASSRSERAQIDELIAAARVPVFLLDEHQIVRPGELGTVADIEAYAATLGFRVQRIDLGGQFRCGGSEAYIQWVLRLLGLARGGPVAWEGDSSFELSVAESPSLLESALEAQINSGYGARMAAGYCWPWSDPMRDGTLVSDVVIGDWSRPWNVRGDRSVGGAPPSALWATHPAGFGQVGCVYTAQGFEYDWNGVLIGPDLVWRADQWVAVRSANKDLDLRNTKKVSDAEFDRLIRNIYKVLLTRGMVGTVIYSADPETRTMLASLVPARHRSYAI